MVFLYALSVLFCMFMSWFMYSFAKDKGVRPSFKEKLEHTVMPFIPLMNLAWVLFKVL